MTAHDIMDPIETGGTFVFEATRLQRRYTFELSRSLGGATVSPGYDDGEGTFVAFCDAAGDPIEVTTLQGWEVRVPRSGKFALKVTGGSPNILVFITPCED